MRRGTPTGAVTVLLSVLSALVPPRHRCSKRRASVLLSVLSALVPPRHRCSKRRAPVLLSALSVLALLAAPAVSGDTAAPAAGPAPDAEALFARHCASCHGADRLGGTGPALLPENLKRLRHAATVIAEGRPATQMPGFSGTLSARAIESLVDLIYTPLDHVPPFGMAEIERTRIVHRPVDTLGGEPMHGADPLSLFIVVEQGDHHITVLDGDRLEPLHRFPTRFALHGGPKFSPDGRFVYLASRDGWITQYDLYTLTPVAEVRAGINTRNLAVSGDGRHVMVANYLPHTLTLLDARELVPLAVLPVDDGRGETSRVSAVYAAPPRGSFVAALKDLPEVWEIAIRDPMEDPPEGWEAPNRNPVQDPPQAREIPSRDPAQDPPETRETPVGDPAQDPPETRETPGRDPAQDPPEGRETAGQEPPREPFEPFPSANVRTGGGLAPRGLVLRRLALTGILDDFFFDPAFEYLIGASREGFGQVVELDSGRSIADIDLPGLPHLGSGITWEVDGRTVLATPNLKEGVVSVIDMATWRTVKRIETLGPGFFMRSHERSRYAWVDVFFGPHHDAVHVIDKSSLEIVETLRPVPGKTAAHVEFTRDGRYALLSIRDPQGALVVYDADTLEEVERLPMSKPSGKYNVYNRVTRSRGTSH